MPPPRSTLRAPSAAAGADGTVTSMALDGTALGERGMQTRARLLHALRSALAGTNGSWASVAEISRVAGVSAGTFYRYVRDIDEACLALAEDLVADATRIAELVSGDWTGEAGLRRVSQFVEAFLEHWDRNRPTLRMRNLAAENGDERFLKIRLSTLRVITRAISAKIKEAQAAGLVRADVVPATAAMVTVGMLERVGSFTEGYATAGGRTGVVATVAVLTQTMVCGPGAAPVGPSPSTTWRSP